MDTHQTFHRFYWWLQEIIAPNLRYCQEVYEDMLRDSVTSETRWLDLGCGHNVLPPWRADEEKRLAAMPERIVGLDYDMPSLRTHQAIEALVRGDVSTLPFRGDAFTLVTANMVFEHLREPETQLEEIKRVMEPGGELVFLTPNCAGYTTILGRLVPEFLKARVVHFFHGRIEGDVFPTFYRMNSPSRVHRAAERSGLIVEEIRLIPSAAQFIKIPPLVIFELIWIRLTMTRWLRALRTNLIVRCRKPGRGPA